MRFLRKIRGSKRLAFGFCPACNSDAPAEQDCEVCRVGLMFEGDGRYSRTFPPSAMTKAEWWARFVARDYR